LARSRLPRCGETDGENLSGRFSAALLRGKGSIGRSEP